MYPVSEFFSASGLIRTRVCSRSSLGMRWLLANFPHDTGDFYPLRGMMSTRQPAPLSSSAVRSGMRRQVAVRLPAVVHFLPRVTGIFPR